MKPKLPAVLGMLVVWLLTLAEAAAYYDPGLQRWINRDPIQEAGGINLYQFAQNVPTQLTDAWGLRAIIVPGGPQGWAGCVAVALTVLENETILGKQMGKDLSEKDVFIIPSDSARADTASRDSPKGMVQLNTRDPHGVPERMRRLGASETAPTDDPAKGLAVTLGHEFGHAIYDEDDPENVVDFENAIRRDLGLSPRKTYGGKSLCQ